MDFGQMIMDQVLGALMFAFNLIVTVINAIFEAKNNIPPAPQMPGRPGAKGD